MANDLVLLPKPRQLTYLGDTISLADNKQIILDGPAPQRLHFTANRLKQALQKYAQVTWSVGAGSVVPLDQIGLVINVGPAKAKHPQGYTLTITPRGIFIVAGTPVGAFYGTVTLIQILQQSEGQLPLLHLTDWPDFPHRGVLLDISRNKVPMMETLFNLIDRLAAWKINQLQLYTEHTFAYQNHPEVWAGASPITGEEILALDIYCREHYIELVPNQNSFGHMRRWLIHERYRPLAECPAGCDTGDPAWGYFEEPFTLCPEDPGSLELVRSLMDELLPHFSSCQFNVGCDETVDLGRGRSRAAVAQRGKGRVYLDFLLKIYREVKARGFTMQFWGDIIMNYPELIPELPRSLVALEWGYEADHPFDGHGARFAAADIPFYVCPGTSSWNSIAGRIDNALENLRNAAENGLKHGAIGYLITDWGDNGHWQPLPVSYPGLAYGAALAWAYEANRNQDVAQITSTHALADPTGRTGRLACDLGRTYLLPDLQLHNSSILFWILQATPVELANRQGLTTVALLNALDYVEEVSSKLPDISPGSPDATLIRREFTWVAEMLQHACRRGIWALGKAESRADDNLRRQLAQDSARLIGKFRQIWLARNRPGGLEESVALLEKMSQDYDG
jgi:hexosaminidase